MSDTEIVLFYLETKNKSIGNFKEHFEVLKDLERIHEADLSELSEEDQTIKLLMEL